MVWDRVAEVVQKYVAINDALKRAGVHYPAGLGGVEVLATSFRHVGDELATTKAELTKAETELGVRRRAYFELKQDAVRQLTAAARRIDALERANSGWREEVDHLHEQLENRSWWARRKARKAREAL